MTTTTDMYTYKMVQILPRLVIESKSSKDGEAAAYLEKIVNQYASEGWEFQRVDSFAVAEKSGCLGSLLGTSNQERRYYVITFRRPTT